MKLQKIYFGQTCSHFQLILIFETLRLENSEFQIGFILFEITSKKAIKLEKKTRENKFLPHYHILIYSNK
jgi:hypothetical protein